ncbi:ribose-phosphate pyrophosphokinase 1-like [Vicia villosa]|uniref:ribose-phosphate pyrophosphokinase 1-like n=1 Tax=Vicia villosa TaxID=3911 RepID=UPI00273C91F0|nr:ribose-phosphate pyrophosphokinase 1-like [Vicia villosa]
MSTLLQSSFISSSSISPITPRLARISLRNAVRCNNAVVFLNSANGIPYRSAELSANGSTSIPSFLVAPNTRIHDLVNINRLRIFSGTANPALAQEIACYMGPDLGKIKIKRFADGEIYVQLQESVRGCDVFLVQPTCPPANENLMELLVMI